jgi:hypothetical protein
VGSAALSPTAVVSASRRRTSRAGDVGFAALSPTAVGSTSRRASRFASRRANRRASAIAVGRRTSSQSSSGVQQLWWCMRRSLTQQRRAYGDIVVEFGIALLAGGLMGASSGDSDRLFQGTLLPPNELLSAAPSSVIPLLGFFVGLSLGVIGSPPAVGVFGTELPQYWREAASGHSRWAYVVGKSLAVLPRITAGALHFTGLLCVVVCTYAFAFTVFVFVAARVDRLQDVCTRPTVAESNAH